MVMQTKAALQKCLGSLPKQQVCIRMMARKGTASFETEHIRFGQEVDGRAAVRNWASSCP